MSKNTTEAQTTEAQTTEAQTTEAQTTEAQAQVSEIENNINSLIEGLKGLDREHQKMLNLKISQDVELYNLLNGACFIDANFAE